MARSVLPVALLVLVMSSAFLGAQRQTVTPSVAPDFTLKDHRGAAIRLAAYRGRVVLVNFWATWCGDCNVELPWFGELQRKYGAAGLTVLGVSLDDTWTPILPAMKRWQMTYPILLGDATVRRLYGVDALPITVLIGRDGQMIEMHRGLIDHDKIDATLRRFLR